MNSFLGLISEVLSRTIRLLRTFVKNMSRGHEFIEKNLAKKQKRNKLKYVIKFDSNDSQFIKIFRNRYVTNFIQ